MAKVLLLLQLIVAVVLLPLWPGADPRYLSLGLVFLGVVLAVPTAAMIAVFGVRVSAQALLDVWAVVPLGRRAAVSAKVWALVTNVFPVAGCAGGLIALTGGLAGFDGEHSIIVQTGTLVLFGLTWGFLGLLMSRVLEQVVVRLSASDRRAIVTLGGEVARRWGLTPRETQTAQAVLDGLTYQAVAEKLSIALATVKSHLLSVYQKSGTGNKIELLRLVEVESRRFHQTVDGPNRQTDSKSEQEESS